MFQSLACLFHIDIYLGVTWDKQCKLSFKIRDSRKHRQCLFANLSWNRFSIIKQIMLFQFPFLGLQLCCFSAFGVVQDYIDFTQRTKQTPKETLKRQSKTYSASSHRNIPFKICWLPTNHQKSPTQINMNSPTWTFRQNNIISFKMRTRYFNVNLFFVFVLYYN